MFESSRKHRETIRNLPPLPYIYIYTTFFFVTYVAIFWAYFQPTTHPCSSRPLRQQSQGNQISPHLPHDMCWHRGLDHDHQHSRTASTLDVGSWPSLPKPSLAFNDGNQIPPPKHASLHEKESNEIAHDPKSEHYNDRKQHLDSSRVVLRIKISKTLRIPCRHLQPSTGWAHWRVRWTIGSAVAKANYTSSSEFDPNRLP